MYMMVQPGRLAGDIEPNESDLAEQREMVKAMQEHPGLLVEQQ